MPLSEEEKEFEKFFNEAVESDESGESPKVNPTEEEVKQDEKPVEEEPEKEEQKTDDDVPADESGDDPNKEQEQPEPESQDDQTDWKAKYEEVLESMKKLEHKMSSWEGRIRKANERADDERKRADAAESKLAEKKEPSAKADDTPSETDDILKEFREEFPDLVKPLEALAKKYAEQIADERLGNVTPVIKEIKETQQEQAVKAFFAPVYDAHADWKTIYDSGELQEWIDTLPPLQQRVFNEVVGNGSQEEIIEMFDTYKKAKGISKDKKTSQSTGGDPKVKDIVAVPGRSAGVPAGKPDMNDYDQGWKDATASS